MNKHLRTLAGLCTTVLLFQTILLGGSMFDKSEYAARRIKFMDKIPDGVAVFLGAIIPPDGREFYQNNDLIYFSGVEIPNAVLVIDGKKKESTLFFTITEKEADGEAIPLELIRNPKEYTGIERIQTAEQLPMFLSRLSLDSPVFYTMYRPGELIPDNTNETYRAWQRRITMNVWDGRLTRELQFVKQLKEKFPFIEVRDCSKLVWDLRKYKSPKEIEVMKEAGRIAVAAHTAVINSTRPGISENELAALFEYVCKKEGAQELAFNTIIMSGKNHAYGHYHKHDRMLQDGDFLILDAGPDYGYYNIDVSTSFPASRKFSPRQRELYELAFLVRKICQDNYRPGVTLQSVGEKVREHLISQGIDPDMAQVRGEIRSGGYNHSVGMATHDPMGSFSREEPLKPGFVFACDIQIIYPEEEVGIRLEDTIAITEDGYVNLSEGLPRTVAEIEALMKTDGIIQSLKKSGLY